MDLSNLTCCLWVACANVCIWIELWLWVIDLNHQHNRTPFEFCVRMWLLTAWIWYSWAFTVHCVESGQASLPNKTSMLMAATEAPVCFAHISTHNMNEDCRILWAAAEAIYKGWTKVVLNASPKCNHQAYLYHIPDAIDTLCDANEIHSQVKQKTYTHAGTQAQVYAHVHTKRLRWTCIP